MLQWLEDVYGEIRTTKGGKYDYLGMDIEYKENREVDICMRRYLQETLDEFPLKITEGASTPAALHLFHVNPEAKKIDEERAKAFHSAVAKMIFVT